MDDGAPHGFFRNLVIKLKAIDTSAVLIVIAISIAAVAIWGGGNQVIAGYLFTIGLFVVLFSPPSRK